MNIVINLVLVLQIMTALVMIGLVLIQHGKGADMGASFGSGASGSLFGATGSANFLSRSTAACAAVFFVCTLCLAYSRQRSAEAHNGQHARSSGGGAPARRRSAPPARRRRFRAPASGRDRAAGTRADGRAERNGRRQLRRARPEQAQIPQK